MKTTKKNIGLALILSLFIFLGKVEAQMSGTYTVGMGGNYLTLTAAYSALVTYGMNGPVTLSVISNLHGNQRLVDSVPGTSTTNTITITSSTGNSNSYIIGIDSVYALYISDRVKNVIIKDITIGVTNNSSQQYGVYFKYYNGYVCDNLEFKNCNINSYTSATTSDYAAVYYYGHNNSNYYLKNVRFIKNSINGGYYNFYFYYLSGDYSNLQNKYGVFIDSNQLTNAYYAGIYTYSYGYFKSISCNKITSRSGSTDVYYGISSNEYTVIDSINRNKIRISTKGAGLYLNDKQNYNFTNYAMRIYNNEIIMEATTGVIYGIYTYGRSLYLYIIHNSIYLTGDATAYGIYWYPDTYTTSNVVYNNIIHINSNVPAYIFYYNSGTYYYSFNYFDYNNYYRTGNNSTTYYGSSSYTSLSAWKTVATNQDVHSTVIATDFIDVSKNLELNNYFGLTGVNYNFLTDIRNNPRSTTPTKGCYEPFNLDACMIKSSYTSYSGTVNIPFSLQVLLQNAGKNSITSATINWKFKDTLRTSIPWSGTLTSGGNASINLPNVMLTSGYTNPIQIWSSNPNNTTDQNSGNDTFSLNIYGCTSVLNGYYTVGGSGADFLTLDDAITAVKICGLSGPVTFALNNGIYNQSLELKANDLYGLSQTNTLTFTSVSNNPDSVKIYASGTTLTLNNVSNIFFRNLTFGDNAFMCEKAVVFKANCSNIEFRNCIINVDTSSSKSICYGISYENSYGSSDYLSNVKIVKNTINGGYYNIYFYYPAGLSSNMGTSGMSVIIDSNRLKNSYYAGIYSHFNARYPSVSYNYVSSRMTDSVYSYWIGICFASYQNVKNIIGNKVISLNEKILYPRGIYGYNYFNSTSYNGDGLGFIINNEIILKGKNSSSSNATAFIGIDIESAYADIEIYHNSIYLHGIYSGSNYGYSLYVDLASTSYKYKIANNNLASYIVSGTSYYLYPIYCSFSNSNCIRDYNNYYNANSTTIAKISSSSYTLSTLRSSLSQDVNSTNINSGFTSGITSLYPLVWSSCPVLSFVPNDIVNNSRVLSKTTYMGCYHPNYPNDAGIIEFTNIGQKSSVGTNPIKVLIRNYGKDTLKTVYINYTINGTLQTPVNLTGLRVPQYKDTVVTIGSFVATLSVTTTLKAWTSYPNGQSDGFTQNDTVSLSTLGCGLVLNGTYDIAGGNNDFTSLGAAIAALNSCGISGNVVLRLASGHYDSLTSISSIYSGSSTTKTVTFTSLANNADSVTIGALTGTAFTLNSAANLRFDKLTIGNATATTYGVNFINTNQNIEFYKCNINSHTSIASMGYACVNYNNTDTSKTLKNIRFIGNVLKGGYANFNFNNAGGGIFNISSMSVIIDSNQLLQSYYYGLYSTNYAYFNSIASNTIKARTTDSLSYFWYGIYLSAKNSADKIVNNRIQSTNALVYYPYGIYIDSNFNNYGTLNYYPIIANNEIIINSVGAVCGISINAPYSNTQIMHNSIYMYGTGSPNALYIKNPSTTYIPVIKNNLLMTNANALSFPIYYQGNYSTSYYICDYNDYYSSGSNLGYAGGMKNSLSTLRTATGQDAHSVNVLPVFYNVSTGLEYKDTQNLKCTGLSNLTFDINGKYRGTSTLIGAYDISKVDLAMSSFITPSVNQKVCQNSSQAIQVSVSNIGNEAVSFSASPLHVYLTINGAITYQKDTVINTGGLQALQSLNVGFVPNVSLTNPGQCNIKVFIDYLDYNKTNDTLKTSISIIPRNTKDTLTLCSSELPLHYGDSTFYASGNYAVSFHSFYGCDSIVSLCLYVNPTYSKTDTVTICQNQIPYHYGDSTMNAAGSFNVHFKTKKGCDSLVVLRLYVNPTYSRNDTVTICQNQIPYHYGDSTFNTAGSFNIHFKTTKGCDSLVMLRLYVNPTYSRNDTVTICQNQLPYHYGDSTMNAAGSFTIHFKSTKGCDSLVVLRLYVNPTYSRNDTVTICQNQIPYHYGDSTMNAAGSFNIHFKTTKGCDSLVVLRLYVNPTYSRNDTVTICQNQIPYHYGDSTLNAAGSYNVHFKTAKGCDSLVVLRLYVNPTYSKTDTVTICQNQIPYHYGDSIITVAGSCNVHFKTKKGCDSLVVLRLYVNPTYSKTDTVTICQSQVPYHYGDSALTISGSYTIHFKTKKGCDSLVVLRLYVNPTYSRTDTVTICQNQVPYRYGDSTFTLSGSYNVYFKTKKGCDSLIVLRLYVNPIYTKTDTVTICQNQIPYHYGDSTLSVAGSYSIRFKTKKGCDSLVVLRLYVNPIFSKTDTVSICSGQLPYHYGDSILYSAGNYLVPFKTIKGCDSLVHLTLYIDTMYKIIKTITICDNELPYHYKDSTFYHAGIYDLHFASVSTCDTLVRVMLYVNNTYKQWDTVTICSNELPYHYGDSVFTTAGNYTIHFPSVSSCDSLVFLRLYVHPTYSKTDTITICTHQLPYHYGDSILYAAGSYSVHFKTVKGCDSLVTLRLYVNPTYTTFDTVNICSDQLPYFYGGFSFTSAGTYPVHFTTIKNCDSLVVLRLYVNPLYSKTDTITICTHQLPYHYGDSILYTAGSYSVHFKTKNACDSLVVLRLYVNSIYTDFDTLTVCANQLPYHYGDSILYSEGNYAIRLTSINGCDSIINVTLYKDTYYKVNKKVSICDNELPYHFGDSTYQSSGIYTVYFTSLNGCDTIIRLMLTVNQTYNHKDTLTICNNELPYHYGNNIFTTAGNYNVNLSSIYGCDSIIALTLNVNPTFHTKDSVIICETDLPYHYGDSSFIKGGDYLIPFHSMFNCDSLILLHLKVIKTPTILSKIYGDTLIKIANIYTYYIDPVEDATSYMWTLFNTDWVGSSTTESIDIYFPKGGTGMISVKAKNQCGISKAGTLSIVSSISVVEIKNNNWSLGQNIPNPAAQTTIIPYTIPKEGHIIFKVISISGQELYSEKEYANSGKNYIELNTQLLSDGIYYYSIEYEGQRIVKKMTIQK